MIRSRSGGTRGCRHGAIGLLLLALAVPTRADQAAVRVDPLVFTRSPKPVSIASPDTLFQRFPAYQPSVDAGGIRFITLPFQSPGHAEGQAGADGMTFAFILTFMLDWHPRDATTRHAYFTFKRQPERMRRAGAELSTAAVADAMAYWSATHAVGGTLHAVDDDRYTCTYVVFGADGERLHTGTTPTNLLSAVAGEVAVAVMQHLDYDVPPALADYLRMPRRLHPESIAELGEAAFITERSDAEFRLYANVFARDPEFGEVCYWSGNQLYWRSQDGDMWQQARRQSLDACILRSALEGVIWTPPHGPPERMAEDQRWIDRTVGLVGETHPVIINIRLGRHKRFVEIYDPVLSHRARVAAEVNPDGYNLIMNFTWALTQHGGPGDHAMAASLAARAMQSPSIPSVYARNVFMERLAMGHYWSGHYDRALVLLRQMIGEWPDDLKAPDPVRYQTLAVLCLAQLGHYENAALVGRGLVEQGSIHDPQFMVTVGWCALLGNRPDIVASMERHLPERAGRERAFTLDDCRVFLENQKATLPQAVRGLAPYIRGDPVQDMFNVIRVINVQATMLHEGDLSVALSLIQLLQRMPNVRSAWILLDALDRVGGVSFPMEPFYEVIHWLHPDDAWVREAHAAFRARHRGDPVDMAAIQASLPPLVVTEWPYFLANPYTVARATEPPFFGGAWLVKMLLAEHRYAEARDVCGALLVHNQRIGGAKGAMAFHYDLLHLVNEAERTRTGAALPFIR